MNESDMKRSDWANAESRRCPNVSAAMFCVCNRGVFGIERVDKPFSSSELETSTPWLFYHQSVILRGFVRKIGLSQQRHM